MQTASREVWGLWTLCAPVIGRAVLISSSGLLISGRAYLLLSTPTPAEVHLHWYGPGGKAIRTSWASPVRHVERSSPSSGRLWCIPDCGGWGREVTPRRAKDGRHIPNDRCMVTLSPEYDEETGLLTRIGDGCGTQIAWKQIPTHPVILDPVHQITWWVGSLHWPVGEPPCSCLPAPPWWFIARHGTRSWFRSTSAWSWSRQPSDQRTADLWSPLFNEPKPMGLRLSSYYDTWFTTTYNWMYLYLTCDHKSIYWLACMRY